MMQMRRDELMQLAAERQPSSLTLYLPYGIRGQDNIELSIHRKNLLKEARDCVEGRVPHEARKRYLEVIHDLENDATLAVGQTGTRLVLINANGVRMFDLPWRMRPMLRMNDHFCLTPLVKFFSSNDSFYLFYLHLNKIALYRCDPSGFQKVDLQVPMRIADEYGENVDEWSLDHFNDVRDRAAMGRRGVEFTGMTGGRSFGESRQGKVGEDRQAKGAEVDYLMRHVDEALKETVQDSMIPLVVACTEKVYETFCMITKYPNVLQQRVNGDQYRPIAELYAEASELVRQHRQQTLDKVTRRYDSLVSSKRVADDLIELERAAQFGLVETLLVIDPHMQMGDTTPEHSRNYEHVQANGLDAKSEDYIERTSFETLAHGGQLFWLPPDKMPRGQIAVGVLRAPVSGTLT